MASLPTKQMLLIFPLPSNTFLKGKLCFILKYLYPHSYCSIYCILFKPFPVPNVLRQYNLTLLYSKTEGTIHIS